MRESRSAPQQSSTFSRNSCCAKSRQEGNSSGNAANFEGAAHKVASPWRSVENVHTQVPGKSSLRRAVGIPKNRIKSHGNVLSEPIDRPFAARPRANLVIGVEEWKHEFERRSINRTVAWLGE